MPNLLARGLQYLGSTCEQLDARWENGSDSYPQDATVTYWGRT